MKSERYFILILTVLLYTNLAAHFMSQMKPVPRAGRTVREIATAFVPPFRPAAPRSCRKIEDVSVYEQKDDAAGGKAERKLVGKEKRETWVPCP